MTPDTGKARFFLRANDLEGQAGLVVHPLDEIRTILCLSASLGRDATNLADSMRLELPADRIQRIHRALYRSFGQPTGFVQSLTQTGNLGVRINHTESFSVWSGHQKAAIIGSKVHGRIEVRGPGWARSAAFSAPYR